MSVDEDFLVSSGWGFVEGDAAGIRDGTWSLRFGERNDSGATRSRCFPGAVFLRSKLSMVQIFFQPPEQYWFCRRRVIDSAYKTYGEFWLLKPERVDLFQSKDSDLSHPSLNSD
jgi:hypothetical protein